LPSTTVTGGSFSLPRCDDKVIVFAAGSATTTFIYDPATNLFATGPAATAVVSAGAFAIQRPTDGRFLVVHAGTTAGTSLYDGGCPLQGTYESEPLHPSGITGWRTWRGCNQWIRV
jgi:hypothetical protein